MRFIHTLSGCSRSQGSTQYLGSVLFLTVILVVLALTGCGGGESPSEPAATQDRTDTNRGTEEDADSEPARTSLLRGVQPVQTPTPPAPTTTPPPAATSYPSARSLPTATSFPTGTPLPTATSFPSARSLPTATSFPTGTPLLTATSAPTMPAPTPMATLTPTPPEVPTVGSWVLEETGTLLHQAVWEGDTVKVETLLSQGEDLDDTSASLSNSDTTFRFDGMAPLHLAVVSNPDPDMAALLLGWGANVEVNGHLEPDYWGDGEQGYSIRPTPLHLAAGFNSEVDIAALLLEWGANTESSSSPHPDGVFRAVTTPLTWTAAFNPSPAVAARLLEWGAGIRTDYVTPLHVAAQLNSNPAMAALFLDHGVNVEGAEYTHTRMNIALGFASQLDLVAATPLHLAAGYNPNPAVAELLLDRGADLNPQPDFEILGYDDLSEGTLLHWVVFYENSDLAVALLDLGADAKAEDSDGNTPCQMARAYGLFTGTPLLGRLCRP